MERAGSDRLQPHSRAILSLRAFIDVTSTTSRKQRLKKMSASSLSRISLPLFLQPARIRYSAVPTALPSSSGQSNLRHSLIRAAHRRTAFFRSIASNGSAETAGVPNSVPVRVAHELLQAGNRYLDVRTNEEFNSGHTIGATNIPYMFKSGLGMTKNPNFVKEVSAVYGKDDEIIIGCLSGKRSLMAATELLSSGFTGVTNVEGGFSAWVQNGLPTEQ